MRDHGTVVELRPRQSEALQPVEPAVPNAVNGTFRPKRVTNSERRPREHLSRDEVLALCKAARANRHGARDAAAIWLAFNHGLRVSELADLRWSDIQWQERRMMVRRLKGSQSGEHPLTEADKRFLGPLHGKGQRPADRVFGITAAGFRKMLARLELPAELAALAIHPHMLRHATGYDMVGRADLQARAAFLGHKRLENTIRYSQLDPGQFEGLRP
jgi:type 1 fimbriae regulatory protein FimB/type 1 fimbriae regulatory protein FimE